jgi:5'-3' exonuclease
VSTALLVDGNNLLARADFAAKGKRVQMSVGETNTAALVLFVGMLSKYVRQVKPTHVLVCFDGGYDFRTDLYLGYKAHREKHHDGEGDTEVMALAKQFLGLAMIPWVRVQGWEADDLIAAGAQVFDDDVVILSGDKDLLQLVTGPDNMLGRPSITQIRPPDDTPWDAERVEAKFGVVPEALPFYLALVGDVSDGVPGVRGIGPKKAVKALETAQWSWDHLVADLEPEQAVQAALMLQLVDLRYQEYPDYLVDAARPHRFQPTGFYDSVEDPALPMSLEDFLARYKLASIHERWASNTLWGEAEQPADLFDDVV